MQHLTKDREATKTRQGEILQAQKALEKNLHEQEIALRAELVEKDKQSCMALAYKLGTICYFFPLGSERNRRDYSGRQCVIEKVVQMEPHWADGENVLYFWNENSCAFNPEEIKYAVFFPVRPPFLDETRLEVHDHELVSLEEVDQGFGFIPPYYRPNKPKRKFERVAVYDSKKTFVSTVSGVGSVF